MRGTCSTHGKMRNAYRILIGKRERERPFGILKHGWENGRTMMNGIL
jgi:hypothetical protein